MNHQFVLRSLKKRPALNIIKILGLSFGLCGILFIVLFLKNELTYDTFHSKASRIYRITAANPNFLDNTHFARMYNSGKIPDLAAYFPEIETYVRLAPIRGGVIVHNEKYYNINEAFICDSTFFDVFDAEVLIGNSNTMLYAPNSLVMSQTFAQKVFGDKDPIGEILSIPPGQYYGERSDFTIVGIMKDFPQNSHFHPDLVTTSSSELIDWWAFTYLVLHKHADPNNIVSGYTDFETSISQNQNEQHEVQAYMQKITDIHLHSHKLREIENNGNMTNIYVLSIAAFILLLISISNFAGLNLGMAGFSEKFIQVNKFLGSTKNTDIKFFTIDSLYIVLPSLFLTILIAIPLNFLIQRQFNINLFRDNFLFSCAVVILFVVLSLLAGLQPALKQQMQQKNSEGNALSSNPVFVSRGIIIMQFTLGIILIASVIVISRQTKFTLNQSMGLQENNIVCFERVHTNVQQKFEVLKAELLKHNSIESVSAMMEPPGGECNDMFRFELEDYDQSEDEHRNLVGVLPVDYSFANVFKLEFLCGNNFSENNIDVEGSGEYILNEAALHRLKFTSPEEAVGKDFKLLFSAPGITIPAGKIIGVVKDFHLSTMKSKVNPLVLFKRDHLWLANFVVAYKPTMRDEALMYIKSVWDDIFPSYPFRYESVEALYHCVYKTEILQARLLTIFTFLAFFISSIGLLGISLLVSQQKIKEIGIRKVNGAKVVDVITMLNIRFVRWIILAFALATPIAWYAMQKWLENFAYSVSLTWWIFALSGVLALGIALITVSWQSWRVANRNPVEALRYE